LSKDIAYKNYYLLAKDIINLVFLSYPSLLRDFVLDLISFNFIFQIDLYKMTYFEVYMILIEFQFN